MNSKFYEGMYFLDYGVGDFWVMYGKGCNMEYSLMECFL